MRPSSVFQCFILILLCNKARCSTPIHASYHPLQLFSVSLSRPDESRAWAEPCRVFQCEYVLVVLRVVNRHICLPSPLQSLIYAPTNPTMPPDQLEAISEVFLPYVFILERNPRYYKNQGREFQPFRVGFFFFFFFFPFLVPLLAGDIK